MNNMNGGDSEDLNEILDDEQSNISEGSDVNSIHEGGEGDGKRTHACEKGREKRVKRD